MNNMKKHILLACACALAAAAFAGAPARRKLTVTVDWTQDNEESRTALAFLKKTVLGYREAGHVIAMRTTLRDGGNVPDIHVTDASGKEVYAGPDKNDAAVALTEAIMNQPVPGQMIAGVELKKFRGADKRYIMGKMKGEALRDIRWFRSTWPSESKKYDEPFKRLSADPEAKAAAAVLMKPPKKRR